MNNSREESSGIGLLACWLAVVLFVGLLGLCYVQMKQKLTADGNLCRELENAVKDLDEKLLDVGTDIRKLSGRPALERRCEQGFIRMVQVTETRIVRLPRHTEVAALSAGTTEDAP